MSILDVPSVDAFVTLLKEMLEQARAIKQVDGIEPPLDKPDIASFIAQFDSLLPPNPNADAKKAYKFAVIDTAARHIFSSLLTSTTIDSPEFLAVWDLFDILSIFCDDKQCEAVLLFWLIEELLESQTVEGCRKVFDYLESRRERITAKDFKAKQLVILRSCNELLRRLSRAEDTAFCGRVFIFLFQSFPLGDRSSVNLRGEYHTENVTNFDGPSSDPDDMEIDSANALDTDQNTVGVSKTKASEDTAVATKNGGLVNGTSSVTPDELYPIFWSMQQYFNQPKRLFDGVSFGVFKSSLESTMAVFKAVQTQGLARPVKATEEMKRGTKRKRSHSVDGLANSFNPKYLTSKDLFELEISDISFRRNILVQMLIVIDFLLSLSARAKEKLAGAKLPVNVNKSVMYADQHLSEEDTTWALETKQSIAEYLKQGVEGPFFYRVVETVLSRDKNWARWKIENCPPIDKPAVTPAEFVDARHSAKQSTNIDKPEANLMTNNKSKEKPPKSLLAFLDESKKGASLDHLKNPKRYEIPSVQSFEDKISLDNMDLDMARDDGEKRDLMEARASKTWRALRIGSASHLADFDHIENYDNLDLFYHPENRPKPREDAPTKDEGAARTLKDRRPVVISGPSGAGKGTMVSLLLTKHSGVFGKKASHTTRAPREGEIHGQHYFFVTKEQYDALRDGGDFLEFNNFNGNDYGTSMEVLNGIIAQGKVPVMEMDYHGIQQLKDAGYAARFIFLNAPSESELEQRLRKRGTDTEEKIQQRLAIAKKEIEQSKVDGFHDVVFVNDDVDATYQKLESYIFEKVDQAEASCGKTDGDVGQAAVGEDTEMATEAVTTGPLGSEEAVEQ